MKSIVIYTSQTGFTKNYAELIGKEANCDCADVKKAGKINLSDYDAVIFGGWFMADTIAKISWFKKKIPELAAAGKKIIVYVVGASPAESVAVPGAIRKNFTDEEWSKIKVFYCPGGLNYDKMNWLSRTVMKMLAKALSSKKDATEDDRKKAEMISSSYSLFDKKYIDPILAELK